MEKNRRPPAGLMKWGEKLQQAPKMVWVWEVPKPAAWVAPKAVVILAVILAVTLVVETVVLEAVEIAVGAVMVVPEVVEIAVGAVGAADKAMLLLDAMCHRIYLLQAPPCSQGSLPPYCIGGIQSYYPPYEVGGK